MNIFQKIKNKKIIRQSVANNQDIDISREFFTLSYGKRPSVCKTDMTISNTTISQLYNLLVKDNPLIKEILHSYIVYSSSNSMNRFDVVVELKDDYDIIINMDIYVIDQYESSEEIDTKENDNEIVCNFTIYYDCKKLSQEFIGAYLKNFSSSIKSYIPINNKFYLLTYRDNEFNTKLCKLKHTDIDIELNYNDDVKLIYDNFIINSKNSSSGIYIFYGLSGNGKTYFIRSLIKAVPDKKFIYLSSNMIDRLSDPSFIGFLTENANSYFIIEDGESCVKKRNTQGANNDAISNILNMADGLLSDAFNIKLIITFNQSINDIDTALLRKGRILDKHEFGLLDKNKATALSKKLNYNINYTEDVSLSEVYNPLKKNQNNNIKKIGFKNE